MGGDSHRYSSCSARWQQMEGSCKTLPKAGRSPGSRARGRQSAACTTADPRSQTPGRRHVGTSTGPRNPEGGLPKAPGPRSHARCGCCAGSRRRPGVLDRSLANPLGTPGYKCRTRPGQAGREAEYSPPAVAYKDYFLLWRQWCERGDGRLFHILLGNGVGEVLLKSVVPGRGGPGQATGGSAGGKVRSSMGLGQSVRCTTPRRPRTFAWAAAPEGGCSDGPITLYSW